MQHDETDKVDKDLRFKVLVLSPDGTRFFVVAAKKGVPFRENTYGGSSLGGMLAGFLLGALLDVRATNSEHWKVGVMRADRPSRIRRRRNTLGRTETDQAVQKLRLELERGLVP